MNTLKWIFINGGLGWGIPFAIFIYALRWIENKPPAFGSFLILLIGSIVGGIVWGYATYKFDSPKENTDFSIFKFLKSMALMSVIFCIYGFIFRYLLIPNNLDHTLWSTWIFLTLVALGVFLHNKFIVKGKKNDLYSKEG